MKHLSIAQKLLICVFLLFISFIAGIGVGGYYTAQEWQIKALAADKAAEKRLADETQKVLDTERKMQAAKADLIKKHETEVKNAKFENDRLRDAVRNGTLRLSVPTSSLCATASAANSGTKLAEARTELDPAFAQSLLDIATDGDDAIRDLNLCIDQYNAVQAGVMRH